MADDNDGSSYVGAALDRAWSGIFQRLGAGPRTPPRWATLLVLAYADDGEFYLPDLRRHDWWNRRLNLRYPAHWPYFLLSALTGWVVWVESEA